MCAHTLSSSEKEHEENSAFSKEKMSSYFLPFHKHTSTREREVKECASRSAQMMMETFEITQHNTERKSHTKKCIIKNVLQRIWPPFLSPHTTRVIWWNRWTMVDFIMLPLPPPRGVNENEFFMLGNFLACFFIVFSPKMIKFRLNEHFLTIHKSCLRRRRNEGSFINFRLKLNTLCWKLPRLRDELRVGNFQFYIRLSRRKVKFALW